METEAQRKKNLKNAKIKREKKAKNRGKILQKYRKMGEMRQVKISKNR